MLNIMKNKVNQCVLCLATIMLLQGCSNDSASYDISDRNHSITLIRDKPYFWSKTYQQSVVIANMPECQRRYKMEDAPLNSYQVDIYDYDESTHLWVVDNVQYYLLNHLDCKYKMLSKAVPIPQGKNALLGQFYNNEDGGLMFKNMVTGQVSPGSEELSM